MYKNYQEFLPSIDFGIHSRNCRFPLFNNIFGFCQKFIIPNIIFFIPLSISHLACQRFFKLLTGRPSHIIDLILFIHIYFKFFAQKFMHYFLVFCLNILILFYDIFFLILVFIFRVL